MSVSITPRQEREIAYHRDFAKRKAHAAEQPVGLDVVRAERRRWWNAYWHTYTLLRRHDLAGKKVLVPGCGFGEDAIRIASLGAEVYGFDISPDIVEITRRRIERLGLRNVHVQQGACERMDYADDSFDLVFLLDIMHHVDIPDTVREIRRVAKDGAILLGNELYTHSFLQKKVRESWLVDKVLYKRMVRYIYGSDRPYITADERKIDERELMLMTGICRDTRLCYFHTLVTRVIPDNGSVIARADQWVTGKLGALGRFLAARAVFEGRIAK